MVAEMDTITGYVEYQASGGTDRSCRILNYVHHSSNILRKVRLGQPLNSALDNKPLLRSQLQHPHDARKSAPNKNTQQSGALSTLLSHRERTSHRSRRLQIPRTPQSLPITMPHKFSEGLRKQHLLLPTVRPIPLKSIKHCGQGYKQHATPEVDDEQPNAKSFNGLSMPDQHNAALIIARFFRFACRLDNAADRTREILHRHWREKRPEKYRTPLFELTNNEQLRVLQLYNPHLYGSHHPNLPIKSTSASIRLSRVPQMEQQKRLQQSQILARMNQGAALLNDASKQKTTTPIAATRHLHQAYQRQSPIARERPKTINERERTQHSLTRSSPNLHYKRNSLVRF